jgi:hypothetical protein
MPAYSLFYPFSHFAVSRPGKLKPIQQLTKLLIIHNRSFFFSNFIRDEGLGIQGFFVVHANSFGDDPIIFAPHTTLCKTFFLKRLAALKKNF